MKMNKGLNFVLNADNSSLFGDYQSKQFHILQWSDERLSPILLSERFPEARTHRELKEMLFHHIIQYFEKGKVLIFILKIVTH